MGRATWETFSGNRRGSYWIQYSETLGTGIKFINNQWYNIFWSHTFNSYYTEAEHYIDEPEELGLGTLAGFLKGKYKGSLKARNTTGKKACPLKNQASIQHQRVLKREPAVPFKKASVIQEKDQKNSQGHWN